jgi:Cdc6-like AAA superfamily ATPase
MSSEGNVVMIGPPGSGKTTFLAALWHQLESSEIQTAFSAIRLQPDREYLNRIRERWLEFEEIPRTPIGIDQSSLLHLRHSGTQAEFDLSIPDVAGETFAAQWHERRVPTSYFQQLQRAFGLVLFVHCKQISRVNVLKSSTPIDSSLIQDSEWEPVVAPTQTQLVDSLQIALNSFERNCPMRTAIVISAWDEVTDRITPASWLQRKLPLLDQFVRANSEILHSRVFGVSAIGGNLADKETLALTPSPSSRVRVHVGSEVFRDLTLPLEFLTVDKAVS